MTWLEEDEARWDDDHSPWSDSHEGDSHEGAGGFRKGLLNVRSYTAAMQAYASEWEVHEFTFAVTMGNESGIDVMLYQVSHPDSPRYGQHLSFDDVHSMASNWEATGAASGQGHTHSTRSNG